VAISVFPAHASRVSPSQEEPAILILKEAEANKQDRKVLEGCLARIEAETKARPGFGLNHYVAGWILSHLGKLEEAVASYDRAFKNDPKLAAAAYNAGVILAGLGRDNDAVERWEAAIVSAPEDIDALYNLAQLHYNRKDFAAALQSWSKARELAPSDFEIAKKVLQATNALGQRAAAVKAREAVFDLWRTSDDPEVRKLTEYVFDQFDVGTLHIFAFETFEPKGDSYNVYAFKAAGPDNKTVGTVQLESSPSLRDAGTPYIIGVKAGGEHRTLGMAFKDLPSYDVLKPLVVKVIEDNIAKKPPSPSTSL